MGNSQQNILLPIAFLSRSEFRSTKRRTTLPPPAILMSRAHNPDLHREAAKALEKPMKTRQPASKPPVLHAPAPSMATCPELILGPAGSQGGSPAAGKLLEEEGEAGPFPRPGSGSPPSPQLLLVPRTQQGRARLQMAFFRQRGEGDWWVAEGG